MDVQAWMRRAVGVWTPVFLVSLGIVFLAGCSADTSETLPQDAFSPATTLTAVSPGAPSGEEGTDEYSKSGSGMSSSADVYTTVVNPVLGSLDRRIVSNASLLIEVEREQFQIAFDQALLLADKYGGYVISSNSSASGDGGTMRSGTISVRVPASSFSQAVSDASKFGTVMSRDIDSQDVTEEYLDLEARLKNAESQEQALLDLMNRAKTIDEVLQVRQYLSQTQTEIEQLKGRMRFLDEHTSYSTLTLSLYEVGTEVASTSGWGFVDALQDGLHAFVDSINSMVVFLGGAIPVLALLALFGWLAFRLVRPAARRVFGGKPDADRVGPGVGGDVPGEPRS